MKFLAICEPSQYPIPTFDIPIFYRKMAEDSRINFFHIPTRYVLDGETNSHRIQVAGVTGKLSHENFLDLDSKANQWHLLEEFDLVFCRTLKPFPDNYLQRLSNWEKYTRFVNTPSNKIEQIQPDFLLKVANSWIPETMVTNNWIDALTFFEKYHPIVAKQYNSCGGRGVFKIWYENNLFQVDNLNSGIRRFQNFSEVIKYVQGNTNQPLQLVRYLHRVADGDKRIVVVNGEIYGAYIRRSKSGYWVNNVSGDGECFLADISSLEREAIEDTFKAYSRLGLHTLGYDFLRDNDGNWRISEINAGNIGGFSRLEMLTNLPIMKKFIDWLIYFAKSSKSQQTVAV